MLAPINYDRLHFILSTLPRDNSYFGYILLYKNLFWWLDIVKIDMYIPPNRDPRI